MNDMEFRIDRGDMKLERAEAIKVKICLGLTDCSGGLMTWSGNVSNCRRPFTEDYNQKLISFSIILKSVYAIFFPSTPMRLIRLLAHRTPRFAIHFP